MEIWKLRACSCSTPYSPLVHNCLQALGCETVGVQNGVAVTHTLVMALEVH